LLSDNSGRIFMIVVSRIMFAFNQATKMR
jgi:hypothetical protein